MAEFVLKHKVLVILAWILVAFVGFKTMGQLGPRLDYNYTTPGHVGFEANRAIRTRFGLDPEFEAEIPVLTLPQGLTMASPQGQALAHKVFEAARTSGPVTVQDYTSTQDPKFILEGGRAAWAVVSIPNPDYGPGKGIEDRLPKALQAATPAGASLQLTGYAPMLSNQGPNAKNMIQGIVLGVILAFVVLLLVYGSLIAILPILMSAPSMLAAFLCVLGLTHVTQVSYFIPHMIVLLSLGISIDFSLMLVIRWREEREKGLPNTAAVHSALRSAGRAIALSGLTAAVGLGSLIVLPVPFLRSVGIGSMVIPFIAVCVSVTLLPVCLALMGPALDRYSLWRRGSTIYSPAWERWGKFVLRHQWKAAILGLAFLALTSLPAAHMQTGMAFIGALRQDGPAAAAFHRVEAAGVPTGVSFPIWVMTHGGEPAAQRAATIAGATPGVFKVLSSATPDFRKDQDALIMVIPYAEGALPQGKAVVTALRARLAGLPGGPAQVGGATAGGMAFSEAVYGGFPLLLTVVSLATMVILLISLRSVVLAVKAVLLNIISLGSAFGFMVFFWQQGHGSQLIYGMPATGAIRMWLPSIVFASLFGLSMDYEVFVLSRIREEYDRTGSTQEAIVGGLARTGRLVTCAALILMVTFLSLSIDPNQIVKIQASTLAVGVIIDAVVIRTLLVPALVSLMGRWNWWMPAGLAKLLPARPFVH
ncbi:MAG TPA: MMPL family transporter [Phenylobacterium sp.]|jgi:RND superfamily putative drug exporter|uniref:MMPL family transporter n=1 Tax=Phenylobacterium sp. TaxID=1871053 RepID=UPI002D6A3CC8|nr:MMPL family transporter [Phenylobacterium sp.]HZZ69504.1 MMPL family transporter [Phenylobacterium sp.]